MREGLRIRIKREGWRGFLKEILMREKVAGESGREARETQVYDRTDPNVTKKKHRVDERTDSGEWETVHEHEEEFPAKHRPPAEDGA